MAPVASGLGRGVAEQGRCRRPDGWHLAKGQPSPRFLMHT